MRTYVISLKLHLLPAFLVLSRSQPAWLEFDAFHRAIDLSTTWNIFYLIDFKIHTSNTYLFIFSIQFDFQKFQAFDLSFVRLGSSRRFALRFFQRQKLIFDQFTFAFGTFLQKLENVNLFENSFQKSLTARWLARSISTITISISSDLADAFSSSRDRKSHNSRCASFRFSLSWLFWNKTH